MGVNMNKNKRTNVHLLKESSKLEVYNTNRNNINRPLLFPFSAKSEKLLKIYIKQFLEYVQDKDLNLQDVAHTLCKRKHYCSRLTVSATTKNELIGSLKAYLDDDERPGMSVGHIEKETYKDIVFVYTGMGPIWWGMGRQLLETSTVFIETVKKCDKFIQKHAGWSLMEELGKSEDDSRIGEPMYAQPANFAVQVGLTNIWKTMGVIPKAVVGHSAGEMAAAYVAGVYSFEEALLLTIKKSAIQQNSMNTGTMLAVGMSQAEAVHVLGNFPKKISIACINSPKAVTLSGDETVLNDIDQFLHKKNIFTRFRRGKIKVPSHSFYMDPYKEDILEALKGIHPKKESIEIFSTVLGRKSSGEEWDENYWWKNVRGTVRFQDAMDEMINEGYNLFIEVGPHPTISGHIKECLNQRNAHGKTYPSLNIKKDEQLTLLETLGGLYTIGYPLDFAKVYPGQGNLIDLPHSPE